VTCVFHDGNLINCLSFFNFTIITVIMLAERIDLVLSNYFLRFRPAPGFACFSCTRTTEEQFMGPSVSVSVSVCLSRFIKELVNPHDAGSLLEHVARMGVEVIIG
jgi:hypothetical protein